MPHITPLLFDTYLATIKNSRGAKSYRDNFALVDGNKKNITKGGALSCAYFVSGLLRTFTLIKGLHTTVGGTLRDLEQSGWVKIKKPRSGCIIRWEAHLSKPNGLHEHIGFCTDATHAMSNSSRTRVPETHHITYGHKKDGSPRRRILGLYWHPTLDLR